MKPVTGVDIKTPPSARPTIRSAPTCCWSSVPPGRGQAQPIFASGPRWQPPRPGSGGPGTAAAAAAAAVAAAQVLQGALRAVLGLAHRFPLPQIRERGRGPLARRALLQVVQGARRPLARRALPQVVQRGGGPLAGPAVAQVVKRGGRPLSGLVAQFGPPGGRA